MSEIDKMLSAITLCDIDQVKNVLSKMKGNIDTYNGYYVRTAITAGNIEIVQLLIDNGATIKNEYLNSAAFNKDLDMLKLLEKNGLDVFENESLLGVACEENAIDVVKYLVEKGLSVKNYDYYPLCISAELGHIELIKYFLIECNQDPDIVIDSSTCDEDIRLWATEYKDRKELNEHLKKELNGEDILTVKKIKL